MNLSKIDITKLVGFLIAALSAVTASQLHALFPNADTTTMQTVAAWIAAVVGFLTLAYSTLTRQTPDGGLHAVYSPTPVPDPTTLTTTAETKASG